MTHASEYVVIICFGHRAINDSLKYQIKVNNVKMNPEDIIRETDHLPSANC